MASYILRNLDPVLWEAFKAKAATEGHGMKFILLRLVTLYVQYDLRAIEDAVVSESARQRKPGPA